MNDINITIPSGASKRLKTAGKYCESDIVVTAEGGNAQPSVSPKSVTFRDYDGTLLYSYTAEEALALSELPPLPSREGLICQEWNWSLADMQEYVASYGVCEIGATYITDDGKTRLYITIAAEGRMGFPLYFIQTVEHGVTIDWGDGSAVETLPGTGDTITTHAYASVGNYVITLDVADGCVMTLGLNRNSYNVTGVASDTRVYSSMIHAVFIGKNVERVGTYTFYYCYSLAEITIPKEVKAVGTYSFSFCYLLPYLVIPNKVQTINGETFYACSSLESISLPYGFTTMSAKAFYSCYSLKRFFAPSGMKTLGNNAFYGAYCLADVVLPSTVTEIEASLFYNCRNLAKIEIPYGAESINNSAFYNCQSLEYVSIPDSVNSIGSNAFFSCYSLTGITLPSSVKSIAANAFNQCTGVAFYDFTNSTSVPTLADANAFSGMPTDCEIRVPAALVAEWKAETNWSAVADNIVGV